MPQEDRIYQIATQVQTLTHTLWGVDGRNGAMSRIRAHDADIATIKGRLAIYDQAQMQIRTVWATVRWIALGVGSLIAFSLTTPVASFLVNLYRAGAGGGP